MEAFRYKAAFGRAGASQSLRCAEESGLHARWAKDESNEALAGQRTLTEEVLVSIVGQIPDLGKLESTTASLNRGTLRGGHAGHVSRARFSAGEPSPAVNL